MLEWLRSIPRPQLTPFFAARVSARAGESRRRAPALLYAYWAAVIFVAAPMLAQHWWGIVIGIVAVGAATATRAATIARP